MLWRELLGFTSAAGQKVDLFVLDTFLETNTSHLKMDGGKMKFLFGMEFWEVLLLMEEILHRRLHMQPYETWDILIYSPYQLVRDFVHHQYISFRECDSCCSLGYLSWHAIFSDLMKRERFGPQKASRPMEWQTPRLKE